MGSGTLRASDREVDKGKSVAPIPAAGGSGDNSGEYEIENAKSSRSICKSCNGKIEKGHVSLLNCILLKSYCIPNFWILNLRAVLQILIVRIA